MGNYIATKYVATPGAEIIGQVLVGMINNVKRDEIMPLIHKYGLETIDPNGWYDTQNVLNFLQEISHSKTNVTENFTAIGMTAGDIPPNITSLGQILEALPFTYKAFFRNVPEEEGWIIDKLSDHHYHMVYNSPYPDDVMYGVLWQWANHLRPTNYYFVVRILESGGDPKQLKPSIFEVKWGETTQDVA